MSRVTALFVGIATLTVISTVAEAAQSCGRGWYLQRGRCVPQDDIGYRRRHRRPGVSVDRGSGIRLNLGPPPSNAAPLDD